MKSPCPIWEGKKIEDTHIVVLIPETVNGSRLNTSLLKKLIKKPRAGSHSTQLIKNLQIDQDSNGSRWILMTKELLPDSLHKSYKQQEKVLEKNRYHQLGLYYRFPQILDAVVGISTHYIRTGEKLYQNELYTFVDNPQQTDKSINTCVGGYTTKGLILENPYDSDFVHRIGVAGVVDIITK